MRRNEMESGPRERSNRLRLFFWTHALIPCPIVAHWALRERSAYAIVACGVAIALTLSYLVAWRSAARAAAFQR